MGDNKELFSRLLRVLNPTEVADLIMDDFSNRPIVDQSALFDNLSNRVTYYLMHFDTPLIEFKFSWVGDSDPSGITISEYSYIPYEYLSYLFPVSLRSDHGRDNFQEWMNRRALPTMRSSYKQILKELKLIGRASLLTHGFGLGLNDCYWIRPVNNPVTWRDINLYDHEFSRRIASIAAGRLEYINEITDTTSSPEYTTDGILPKYWKRENGSIYLYKRGERESAREVVASSVLDVLKIQHVGYTCEMLEGIPYSRCEIFTTEKKGHVPFLDFFVKNGRKLENIYEYESVFYENRVDFSFFKEMVLADYILQNVDRHFTNFGFQMDNMSGKILGFSPLFDHGLCLFGKVEFTNERILYLKSLPPTVDHFEFISGCVNPDLSTKLEELRIKCKKGGSIHNICCSLAEKGYWSKWSCDNSLGWMIKACDTLLLGKNKSSWNRYCDPSYMEIF